MKVWGGVKLFILNTGLARFPNFRSIGPKMTKLHVLSELSLAILYMQTKNYPNDKQFHFIIYQSMVELYSNSND